MSAATVSYRTHLAVSAAEAFRWHAQPGALERLTPPWEPVQVLERNGDGIADGARVTLGIRLGPLRWRWVSEHCGYRQDEQFCDVQIAGPFARWEHTHRFVPDGAAACYLEDRITYALPLGPVAQRCAGALVRRKLDRLFAYRHRITQHDLAAHELYREDRPMHILVTGASGLVGSALVPFLTTGGHRVSRLVRSTPRPGQGEIPWQPETGSIATPALEGVDAVVHLAGESIATGRWTAEKKAKIRASRVQGTRLLCEALAQLVQPPRVLVSASAMGYYGDRGAESLHEASQPGTGFLAEVCQAWEAATAPAVERGIRVVHLRLGVVLSPAGGALAQMLVPFKLGAGGVIGSGRQYMSWIALDDAIGVILHALLTPSVQGPVNAVAPQPLTNRDFVTALGRVLGRPTLLPLPALAARFAFGEIADALLLASTRVEPRRLIDTGYVFRYPELDSALRHLLGKPHAA
jgi:uncharacterized protein (TIGR01777 family)